MASSILSLTHNLREEELIGRGGFGRVFRVFHTLDDQYYAVKKIIITENNIKTALHEIRVLASIIHPNIIRYYHSWIESRSFLEDASSSDSSEDEKDDALIHQDMYYFFNIQMEYCDCSLRKFLWDRSVVDGKKCFTIMTQIVEGLYFLHQNDIIHRDMKPDNILISYTPFCIKITDFGLAKVFSKKMSLTESTTYAGSLLYASPEQYNGQNYSFSTDIYSLGVILLEIQQIFETGSERIACLQQFREHRKIPIHTLYQDLITNMTDRDPNKRPTSIQLHLMFHDVKNVPLVICRDMTWDIINTVLNTIHFS
jgi:serine/threonine protein kinase